MRIGAEKLAQRVDDDLVVMDESTGEEVVIRGEEVEGLKVALGILFP